MIGRFIGGSLTLVIHSCQQITQLRPKIKLKPDTHCHGLVNWNLVLAFSLQLYTNWLY